MHTPGKYEIEVTERFGPDDFEGLLVVCPESETIICEMAGGLPEGEIWANAERIVRAVNCYEEMLQVLTRVHEAFEQGVDAKSRYSHEVRAALRHTGKIL